jgi:hypothetical protein
MKWMLIFSILASSAAANAQLFGTRSRLSTCNEYFLSYLVSPDSVVLPLSISNDGHAIIHEVKWNSSKQSAEKISEELGPNQSRLLNYDQKPSAVNPESKDFVRVVTDANSRIKTIQIFTETRDGTFSGDALHFSRLREGTCAPSFSETLKRERGQIVSVQDSQRYAAGSRTSFAEAPATAGPRR